MDICPKGSKGRHKPRSLAALGDPKEEVVQVFCDNCKKVLYEKSESIEIPFPGVLSAKQRF
jgi:hypothetical protein